MGKISSFAYSKGFKKTGDAIKRAGQIATDPLGKNKKGPSLVGEKVVQQPKPSAPYRSVAAEGLAKSSQLNNPPKSLSNVSSRTQTTPEATKKPTNVKQRVQAARSSQPMKSSGSSDMGTGVSDLEKEARGREKDILKNNRRQIAEALSLLGPEYDNLISKGREEFDTSRQNDINTLKAQYAARGIGDSEQAVQAMGRTQENYANKLEDFMTALQLNRAKEEAGIRQRGTDYANEVSQKFFDDIRNSRQQAFQNALALRQDARAELSAERAGRSAGNQRQQAYGKAFASGIQKYGAFGEGKGGREALARELALQYPDIASYEDIVASPYLQDGWERSAQNFQTPSLKSIGTDPYTGTSRYIDETTGDIYEY